MRRPDRASPTSRSAPATTTPGILCELEASWLPASFADAGGGTGSRVRLPSCRSTAAVLRRSACAPRRRRSGLAGRARPGPHPRRRRGRAQSRPHRHRRFHPRPSGAAAPLPRHHLPHPARRHARGLAAAPFQKARRWSTSTSGSGSSPPSRTSRSARSPWAGPIPRRAPAGLGRWACCRSAAAPA